MQLTGHPVNATKLMFIFRRGQCRDNSRRKPLRGNLFQRVGIRQRSLARDITIRFDIDAGRVMSRQLDWDEDVVGFQGPSSNLEYQSRLTETLEKDEAATATLQGPLLR